MSSQLGHPKIRPEHLDRRALIYVRQSTPMQVRDNIASAARQYDLARSADRFGWPRQHIQVIDQDQGHSGASAIGRDGFQYLMAQVCLGHVGAVLSLEASRLARSNSDWCRLIEICSLTDTLVIDEDGVYDPTQSLSRKAGPGASGGHQPAVRGPFRRVGRGLTPSLASFGTDSQCKTQRL